MTYHTRNSHTVLFDSLKRWSLVSRDLKQHSKSDVLGQIKKLNKALRIIEFGNDEINETIELMGCNDKCKDFEDTIQYVMARRAGCDYIISNDKNFASGDVPLLSSEQAIKELQ